ncbi:proton-conducting transporter membrane subunit [Geopsychrobacter electrodiphilus]|uniref:proton-conducting transporter transmembrane domain-containing protein n=1 Tax=Geopsychrobacter electrodiphilus TaxID=225196 RepID=UPI0003625042|nr:proton-conducting transporter membrane subunit [Geopsychrobacter electrodiphilus]
MIWLIGAILLTSLAGVPGLFCSRQGTGGERLACLMSLVGCVSGVIAVGLLLVSGHEMRLELPWTIPGGALALRLDAITATFLLPLFLVVATGAVYGLSYWPQSKNPANGRKLRLFYGLLSGSMILLLSSRNGVLFLMGWEVMALAGYFLITTEDHKEDVRRAGFIYLIATHSGTLALFALFALLDQASGSLMFPAAGTLTAASAGLMFLLGLFGFGMKAGIMPLHIWLPGAHAAAPSHASAILSGVMIKTGIYGLVRLTSFFVEIPPWWGWTMLLLGIISGIMGVALALAQHDIKRLLAYHSVENIGIISLGLGLALLGRSYHVPALVALGLAGCLLHVANHGLFKSLLFLSAGSVIHAVGSRDIDSYGGLLKSQPWTGTLFLGAAVAICGLPPFNGFISEWLIYLGSFQPLRHPASALGMAVLAAPALALIGALALACFVKVFGITFLGEPRSTAAAQAHEAPGSMLAPMALLLVACAWIGLLPTTLVPLLRAAVVEWSGSAESTVLGSNLAPLGRIGLIGWLLVALLGALALWLKRRSRTAPHNVGTWGCGYQFPTARMQYTASSFADMLVQLFNFGLLSERHGGKVTGLFAAASGFESHTPDAVLDRILFPGGQGIAWFCRKLRALIQNGRIASYLLYVALTVIALLALFVL